MSATPPRADEMFGPEEPSAAHLVKLAEFVDLERAKREARRIIDAEERGASPIPEILTLRDRLARPRPPRSFRIAEWQPSGSRLLVAAQFKAGKTTLVDNLVRSLVDGDAWLGRFDVTPPAGTVVVIDLEMNADQRDDWMAAQGIRATDRVVPIPLKGRVGALDLLTPAVRNEWAQVLRTHRAAYVVLDCLRPVLDALGLDEHRDAGRFLVAFDALLMEAGVTEAAVIHHMGHAGERSRGDSRLRDWPDVEVRLVRQDDDPASARYVTAYGRDVDVRESELAFDPLTRRLTISGGNRKDAAAREALADVLAAIDRAPDPLSQRGIEEVLQQDGSEHTRAVIRRAIRLGITDGVIHRQPGPRRSWLHVRSSAPVRRSAPSVRQCTPSQCASAPVPIGTAHTHTEDTPTSAPNAGFTFDPSTAFAKGDRP